ncbi:DUF4188 domain-containing protein [Paenibacillus lemnae]|uniref:DUF4188 domain-containing protein n=1 Tax=Paenibacillus lemnae TaxID=1330551 RepID=A0A848M6Q8_PAELE|nr:DUF4188 domain-containing protein [Paenibacillus lemnae]NMO96316.1 DUF4188 domain-containing protein [Paenibacillus lemnae]
MSHVIAGRYTAEMEDSFVVFIIGMRINKLWAVHKWLPVFQAMGPMISELYQNKELGFLNGTFHLSPRGATVIQYWRSFEELEHYARHGEKHLTAWKNFNRKIGTDGSVGIYHESYLVSKGQYEAMYNNMPVYGLAAAGSHLPATGRRETAGQRLGRHSTPAIPSPPDPEQS